MPFRAAAASAATAAGLYARSRAEDEEFTRTLFEWAYPKIAERCRKLGLPYPSLDENGQLERNPFADEKSGRERAQ